MRLDPNYLREKMKRNNLVVEEVVSYILGLDLDELAEITRYKIAAKFKVNKNYLSYTFKKNTKMSVLQFIDFEKMNRAATMLRERQNLTIEDISKQIGVINGNQFRSKFKNKYFLNPYQYRKIFK